MWWLLTGAFMAGLFGWFGRRTTVNNYNETYVDADVDGGGSNCCDDSYDRDYDSGSSGGGTDD
jgi:hypothetical protein